MGSFFTFFLPPLVFHTSKKKKKEHLIAGL